MKHLIFIVLIIFVFNCTAKQNRPEAGPKMRDCCSDVYFVPISISEQPTYAFIDICKSFMEINFIPIDSIYKFKMEEIAPPKGVDTISWYKTNCIKRMWSIEYSSIAPFDKIVDFKLTELLFTDQVLKQHKSTIPTDVFGTFFSNSDFFRLDSSVIHIQVLNTKVSNCRSIVREQIRNRWLYRN